VLDHVFLRVGDLETSRRFYEAVLEPLGHGYWAEGDEPDGIAWVAFGSRGNSLWIIEGEPTRNLRIAFAAPDPAAAQAFHEVAAAVGYRNVEELVLAPDENVIDAVFSDRKGDKMIDHLGLAVRDYQRSRGFYVAALAPLGYELLSESAEWGGGFGRDGKAVFWIREGEPAARVHVAFAAPDTATVDAFHAAAVGAGGEDNGAPGLRPQYHASYYGAFVHDPDGNNVEAVNHGKD
jgi:catechol 2,3-dioxygenase-like lactoylglutathione lyase family enzyme